MARRAKDPPVPGTVGKRWLRRSERKHRKRPDGEERQDSVASTLQIAIRPAALRALENRTRRNPSVLSAFSAFAVAAFSAPRLMARQARGIQGASGRLSRQTSQTADDAERAARGTQKTLRGRFALAGRRRCGSRTTRRGERPPGCYCPEKPFPSFLLDPPTNLPFSVLCAACAQHARSASSASAVLTDEGASRRSVKPGAPASSVAGSLQRQCPAAVKPLFVPEWLGRHAPQVEPERVELGVGHPLVDLPRHERVDRRSVGTLPLSQHTHEVFLAPGPDSGRR